MMHVSAPPPYSVLAHSFLFNTLSDSQLWQLLGAGQVTHLLAGSVLSLESDLAEALFVVLSGDLRLFMIAADHKRELTIATRQPGDIITAANNKSLFLQAKKPSELLQLPEQNLHSLLGSGTAQNLLQLHKKQCQELLMVIQRLAFQKLRSRLAAYLLEQATSLPFTLQSNVAIAAELATVPEVISRQLTVFHKEGLLSIDDRIITRMNTHSLQALAQEF